MTIEVKLTFKDQTEMMAFFRPVELGGSPDSSASVAPAGAAEIVRTLEETKTARGAKAKKGDTPAPVESAAPAAVEAKISKDEVRKALELYGADKRFGMDGVVALLAEFDVKRISDLPADKYGEFKATIEERLTAKVDPLA